MFEKTYQKVLFVALILLLVLTILNSLNIKKPPVAQTVTNDNIAPSVSIIFPQNNYISKTSQLTVEGVASDNVGLKEIRFKYNNENWETLPGLSPWSKTIGLNKGENFIYVQSFDKTGNASPINSIRVDA